MCSWLDKMKQFPDAAEASYELLARKRRSFMSIQYFGVGQGESEEIMRNLWGKDGRFENIGRSSVSPVRPVGRPTH